MFCVLLRRRVSLALLGTCSFIAMKFIYIVFFTVNSPVIFPKYIFVFLFNYESLNEILLTSIGSVVERRTRVRTKVRGSYPTDCFACLFGLFICNFFLIGFFLFLPTTDP